jgi:hypothetical protein
MLIKKHIENVLILIGLVASVRIIFSFAFLVIVYYRSLFDTALDNAVTEINTYGDAYRICLGYCLISFVVGLVAFVCGFLEIKKLERFHIVHWVTFLGIFIFLAHLTYAYLPQLVELRNQVLYQNVFASRALPIYGVVAAAAPLIVWLSRRLMLPKTIA